MGNVFEAGMWSESCDLNEMVEMTANAMKYPDTFNEVLKINYEVDNLVQDYLNESWSEFLQYGGGQFDDAGRHFAYGFSLAAGYGSYKDKVRLGADGQIMYSSRSGYLSLEDDQPDQTEAEGGDDLPAGLTPQYVIKMVGAFLGELVYQNHLNSLSKCVVGGPETVRAVTKAINAMTQGDEHSAFIDGIKAMNEIQKEISNCKDGAPADIMALATWFKTVAGSK